MKKLIKILTSLLVLFLGIAFIGCKNSNAPDNSNPTDETTISSESTTTSNTPVPVVEVATFSCTYGPENNPMTDTFCFYSDYTFILQYTYNGTTSESGKGTYTGNPNANGTVVITLTYSAEYPGAELEPYDEPEIYNVTITDGQFILSGQTYYKNS